jgi:hypothetical protein
MVAKSPLPGVLNVEVVLRHFHRSCSQEQSAVVLLLGRALDSRSLAMDELGEHEDLCGSGHWSVIPHIHRRMVLYCSSLALPV